MSNIPVITQSELDAMFDRDLAESRLTWDEFVIIAQECSHQCGCALYDERNGDSLHFWWKNRDMLTRWQERIGEGATE